MGRGYSDKDIRERLISILEDSDGISGVEISNKMGISRVTMTKYLKVFAAEGLLRQKDIGNVTLWFLEPGQEAYNFPDDYFKVASEYLEYLVKNSDNAYSLIKNCLHSGAVVSRLVFEVILPAIDSVEKLFEDGKIGTAERNLLQTSISRSLQILNQIPVISELKKNIVLIAADSASSLILETAFTVYHSKRWRVSNLGDMSSAIDVLFDLDFEKLIGKIWKQKPGILMVVVFSKTDEGFHFFADSINPTRKKLGKQAKLVLCGKTAKNTKKSDLASENIKDVLQWSESTFDNIK